MAEWNKTGKRVPWNRLAGPVVGGKSAAGNRRAEKDHECE